jgi:two-component system sensor histidine kinase KdpD
MIEQVLINLIENAIKHSPADSCVDVVVMKSDTEADFEVSDCGAGISEQELPYLFDGAAPGRKHSSDSSRGMGIGLSICMSIIKAHQGKMEAFNRPEGGALFRFSLPLGGNADDEQ